MKRDMKSGITTGAKHDNYEYYRPRVTYIPCEVRTSGITQAFDALNPKRWGEGGGGGVRSGIKIQPDLVAFSLTSG